ncbi:MAG: phosphotyrosine protein phosphatase [Terracidiphilus sp.]|jgi:predicted protein tyrosine phosphatase
MYVLFICSQNQLRSPTGEAVFKDYPGIETGSAGTGVDANKSVTEEMIRWTAIIFAMENLHYKLLKERFGELIEAKEVIILRIRDEFLYMDPKLIEILKQKVTPHLE